jgi:hypothetical protein
MAASLLAPLPVALLQLILPMQSELIMACRTRLQIVALLVAGLAFAPAAQAQHHRGSYGGGHRGGHGGDATGAIIGGIIGLGLLGAAISAANQPPAYYAPPPVYYPNPGYYPPPPPTVYYGTPSYGAPAYAPAPSYAPQTGGGSANDLNRQELNRLQAAPAYPSYYAPPRY